MISSTLMAVLAQRLVRKICQRCRIPAVLTDQQAGILGRKELAGCQIYEAPGCKYCAGTGYVGRTGIFELLHVDQNIGLLIAQGASEQELHQHLAQGQLDSLFEDGFAKLAAGITSFSEIAGVISHY